MKRRTAVLLGIITFTLLSSPSECQEKHYFFYKPTQSLGSDATFTPLTLLLNGSFDSFRLGTETTHDISSYKFATDFQNVWNNITHPVRSIRAFGWDRFRRQELFNLSLDINDLQFVPNISDHVIGYGMQYAKITEWYDAHGYSIPVVWGIGTSLLYQYLNEMAQNGGEIYTNVDCISDFDFFNILGYALFSFDDVKRFFSERVQLNDWSLQPLYVPRNHHLENVGQEFVMRYRLPFAEKFAPFVCWGASSVVGLGYRCDDQNSVSFGIGQTVTSITMNYRGEYRSPTPNLEGTAGLFWDNDGSLLAGLMVWGKTSLNAQLNVYPGLVELWGIRPGCYIGVGEREGLVFGITFLGLPVSLGIER